MQSHFLLRATPHSLAMNCYGEFDGRLKALVLARRQEATRHDELSPAQTRQPLFAAGEEEERASCRAGSRLPLRRTSAPGLSSTQARVLRAQTTRARGGQGFSGRSHAIGWRIDNPKSNPRAFTLETKFRSVGKTNSSPPPPFHFSQMAAKRKEPAAAAAPAEPVAEGAEVPAEVPVAAPPAKKARVTKPKAEKAAPKPAKAKAAPKPKAAKAVKPKAAKSPAKPKAAKAVKPKAAKAVKPKAEKAAKAAKPKTAAKPKKVRPSIPLFSSPGTN